jgi:hypothetical protein
MESNMDILYFIPVGLKTGNSQFVLALQQKMAERMEDIV